MIGQPANQPAIQDDPGQIAQLVEVNAHNDAILQDELEQVRGPPFWKYNHVLSYQILQLLQAAPEHSKSYEFN